MRSRSTRRGSALVEAALALPALLTAAWMLVGGVQYGLWKIAAQAACGAGAQALAAGAAPVRAEWVTLQALHVSVAEHPVVTVSAQGTLGTVQVALDVPTAWGWLPVSAEQTAVLTTPAGERGFVP